MASFLSELSHSYSWRVAVGLRGIMERKTEHDKAGLRVASESHRHQAEL